MEKIVRGAEPFEQILPVLAGAWDNAVETQPQRNQWQSSRFHQQNTTLFICRQNPTLLLSFLWTECLGWIFFVLGSKELMAGEPFPPSATALLLTPAPADAP